MKRMAFVVALVFSIAVAAEAAHKGSRRNPSDLHPGSENACAVYGCNDDGNQSSDDTYDSRSGSYEGNDRDSGTDYINGMPY